MKKPLPVKNQEYIATAEEYHAIMEVYRKFHKVKLMNSPQTFPILLNHWESAAGNTVFMSYPTKKRK